MCEFLPTSLLDSAGIRFPMLFPAGKKGFRVLSKLKISFFGWILGMFSPISLLDYARIRFPMLFPVGKKGVSSFE